MNQSVGFCTIDEAVAELRAGRMLVLVDDESRENEGDLIFPAETTTPAAFNFVLTHARGYPCLALDAALADRLELGPQTPQNEAPLGTAFLVSVDAREGIGTGTSASDRAHSIRVCMDPATTAADLVRPGHINPLRCHEAGVLGRPGHTEASVDLVRLAGFRPGAVICEILREDGEMARLPELREFCRRWDIALCHIQDLIRYLHGQRG